MMYSERQMRRILLCVGVFWLASCSDSAKQGQTMDNESFRSLKDSLVEAQQAAPTIESPIKKGSQEVRFYQMLSKADSLQIGSYLQKLNEEFEAEENTSYSTGQVHYSPDSLWKIYVLEGESCGIHCVTICTTYIHWQIGGKKRQQEVNFTPVDTIYQLPTEGKTPKYVVMQHCSYLVQSQGHSSLSVTIISLENDSVTLHPFVFDDTKPAITTFSVEQPHGLENELVLTYTPSHSLFKYQYIYNYLDCCEVDTDSLFEGSFQYAKGKCKKVSESAKLYR